MRTISIYFPYIFLFLLHWTSTKLSEVCEWTLSHNLRYLMKISHEISNWQIGTISSLAIVSTESTASANFMKDVWRFAIEPSDRMGNHFFSRLISHVGILREAFFFFSANLRCLFRAMWFAKIRSFNRPTDRPHLQGRTQIDFSITSK